MRDGKRAVGLLALLVALPAWASDMAELGLLLVLPPMLVLVIVACIVGGVVRKPTAALVWGVLLLVLAVPAVRMSGLLISSSFHGSELSHEGMFNISALMLLALLASYAWCLWRLFRAFRGRRGTSTGSRPL
jgi:cation transport ATPase